MNITILKRLQSHLLFALTLAGWLMATSAQAATLDAQLDRSHITLGDQVRLSIELPGGGNSQPDLSPLKQDFDLLGSSSNSQVQIINGNISQSSQLIITLAPHSKGKLTIPALKIGADTTQPLSLTVGDVPVSKSAQAGDSVWLEMDSALPNTQATVVQQEIPITVRLYSATSLHGVTLTPPAPTGAVVEKIDRDKLYRTRRKGQIYQVMEQHYAVFPEQPGQLSIPPVVMRGIKPDPNNPRGSVMDDPFFRHTFRNNPLAQHLMNDPFFRRGGRGEQISLRSQGLQFQVDPIPAEARGKTWLPARKVTLSDSWQENPPQLRSGEPVSLTLTVTADGLLGPQIPAIPLPEIPGVRVYPEPAQSESRTNGEQVTGISTQQFTLIPEQAGALKLPAISLPWWNTQTRSLETAELPVRTLEVAQGSTATPQPQADTAAAPALSATEPPPSPEPTAESNPKPSPQDGFDTKGVVIGAILLVLLLAVGWAGYRHHHRSAMSQHGAKTAAGEGTQESLAQRLAFNAARDAFLSACSDNDPHLAAKTLLDWAKRVWPNNPPLSLTELATRVETGAERLGELHQRLYQSDKESQAWNGESLAAVMRQGLKPRSQVVVADGQEGLPPLYPA